MTTLAGCTISARPAVDGAPSRSTPLVVSAATPRVGASPAPPAAPRASAPAAAAAAVPAAVTFLRAALTAPTPGAWLARAHGFGTPRLQHDPPPAPPATGRLRVLSAQLATDTPSTGGTAHVEAAALVTPSGGVPVPVTAYLTLTRGRGGWLVDSVQSWT